MEIQNILGKFGCQSFGHMIDAERGVTIVQFKWRERQISLEASWKGYAAAWQKAHPWANTRNLSRQEYDAKALGMFMPHMLLPTGERLIDRVKAENFLPPPDDKKILEFKS
jgi:hypothetical protein